MLYLYSFFNVSARWEWVVNATPRLLHPRERSPVPILQEAGWATETVWTDAKILHPQGFDPQIALHVVSR